MAVVSPLCALVAVSGTSTTSGSGVPDTAAAVPAVRDATTVGVVDATVLAAIDDWAVEDATGLAEALPVVEATAVDEAETVAFAVAEFALVCVIALPLTVTGVPPSVTGVALATGVVVTEPDAAVVLFAPPAVLVAEAADACVGCAVPPAAGCT